MEDFHKYETVLSWLDAESFPFRCMGVKDGLSTHLLKSKLKAFDVENIMRPKNNRGSQGGLNLRKIKLEK